MAVVLSAADVAGLQVDVVSFGGAIAVSPTWQATGCNDTVALVSSIVTVNDG